MQKNKLSPYKKQKAFTLLELLVVITIIAVLALIAFPVGGAVMNSAKKAKARGDMSLIIAAVSAYRQDYVGRFPVAFHKHGNYDLIMGDDDGDYSTGVVMSILMAKEPDESATSNGEVGRGEWAVDDINPKHEVYLRAPIAKGGVGGVDPANNYYDPWGHEYLIALDSGYDNDLSQVQAWGFGYNDSLWVNFPNLEIAVWSYGPDKVKSESNRLAGSDDIASWDR